MTSQLSIPVLVSAFCLLFTLNWWGWKKKSDNPAADAVIDGHWDVLHLSHTGSIVIMLLATVLLFSSLPMYLLKIPEDINYWQIVSFLFAVILISKLTSTPNAKSISYKIPAIGLSVINNAIVYIILRTVYLVFYEWFFRGCLLFVYADLWGIIPSVIINILLYMLIHSFKTWKEWVGCIPFGLVLCSFTLWSQSVWPAIILHLFLSFSHEARVLKQIFVKPLNYKT